MKAGFATTGICPIDPNNVLRKMPGGMRQDSSDNTVAEAIEKMFASQRYGGIGAGTLSRRRPPAKRIKVTPGKSVGNMHPNDEEWEAAEESDRFYHNVLQHNTVAAPNYETVVWGDSIQALAKNDFVAAIWEKS